jgi:hypothetical protein
MMAESFDRNKILVYLKQVGVPADPDEAPMRLSGGDSPLVRPFVDGVATFLVHDEGDSLRLLMERDLERLELDSDMAFSLGVENLLEFGASEAVTWNRYGAASVAVIAGGTFEASFLLVPDIWPQIARSLNTRTLVAAAPARDLLMVAADDPAGRAEVSEMLRRTENATLYKPLTRSMLQWNGSAWNLDTV